jgi:hypothetical protein
MTFRTVPFRAGLICLWLAGFLASENLAQTGLAGHAECTFFGPKRERFLQAGLHAADGRSREWSAVTEQVSRGRPKAAGALRAASAEFRRPEEMGAIDRRLFQAMEEAGVTPARKTDDFEFIRRVTLDLTGRVPRPERLLAFIQDGSPDKRRRLVEELLASDEWVDKWTMFFGDLLKNNARNAQVTRYPEGRNAFYRWIRSSLAANKPYDRMVTELITTTGANSFEQGEVNWLVGGLVMGSPRTGQDIFDQQAANVAATFLGMAHMDCLLCHDGRRHLDTLSLWGKSAKRWQAWELASFFSRTNIRAIAAGVPNRVYYAVEDNVRFRVDYPLNTETGNRPPRQPVEGVANVAPKYLFSGRGPKPGENYRAALARELTSDLQFARAIVNYIWREFFTIGLVEPPDQFDPARLDPDNPPPDPWKLQPSHPRLLNELAAEFAAGGFDLKDLMRKIVNSEAYQLSSRYEGEWNPEWARLYARKLVRRLWAEEIHDAIAQTSGLIPEYRFSDLDARNWAMQFPEPAGFPAARNATTVFLDSFLRGNRDDQERRPDGSVAQALALMNHPFVVSRCRVTGNSESGSLAARVLAYPDPQLVDALFLTILSRYPSEEERAAALKALASGDRRARVEDLQWVLYNKVDFIFNY